MSPRRSITEADILPMAEYASQRSETRRRIAARKRNRRVEVGPCITFYFENWESMWLQVQEMLYVEKGGAAQIPGELAAYNPLVPQGDELVATFMIEIDDERRRSATLARLGGIEDTAFIRIGGETIRGRSEEDAERTRPDGKASSVQFVHFHFTPAQIDAFRSAGAQPILGFDHPEYSHMAVLGEAVRAELATDFA